jgi:hypothetical protein
LPAQELITEPLKIAEIISYHPEEFKGRMISVSWMMVTVRKW